ncbi:MAG TPA: hypothetical protein VFC53_01160 [Dehalococcoidia bacterium]|jgi:hypothetical protein|nr:hypothetical protein [Dehalococcoidia bacterium]
MAGTEELLESPEAPGEGSEYPLPEQPAPLPQVPSYIAIIRIAAVLGMGLSLSFGLFIMLIGLRGVLIGVPIALLSVVFYGAMRLAERILLPPEALES